jgi:hypothetical protein
MTERKTYCTRLNQFEAETVDKIAAEVWPEHADNISELLRAIITDWRHTRDAGGKSNKILTAVRAFGDVTDWRYAAIAQALERIANILEKSTNVHRQQDQP